MTNSSPSAASQVYNCSNSKPCSPSGKKPASISFDEPTYSGRVPNTSIRISTETGSSLPSSPGRFIKSISKRNSSMMPSRNSSSSQKRHSSATSLSNLIVRRKSLQTTALATRRQSLWMSIAKNPSPSTHNFQPSPLPVIPDESNLMRKKILRLLLVFSYLLSISVFAIALATFYGFFWSGYTIPQPATISDVKTNVPSLISFTSNSTFVNRSLEIVDVS
jgi:hypothetical protein